MSHTTEIIKTEKVGGFYAVTIRCCNNPSSDSIHTMALDVFSDPDKRQQSIQQARESTAANHELIGKAEEALHEELGKEVAHP